MSSTLIFVEEACVASLFDGSEPTKSSSLTLLSLCVASLFDSSEPTKSSSLTLLSLCVGVGSYISQHFCANILFSFFIADNYFIKFDRF